MPVGISIVEYCNLFVTLKLVQSAFKIREGHSLKKTFEIEDGGLISSKDGHRDKVSNGIITHVDPDVNSRIIVVPH